MREARAEARNDFRSSEVKSLLTPISPIRPARIGGCVSPPPTSLTMNSVTASTSIAFSHSGWVCSR
jgi:hypothetical protein